MFGFKKKQACPKNQDRETIDRDWALAVLKERSAFWQKKAIRLQSELDEIRGTVCPGCSLTVVAGL